MKGEELAARLRASLGENMPLPGGGETPARHRRLMEIGRQDLSLARLAEAHWDAVPILAEAGRTPERGVLYAIWASGIPDQPLTLGTCGDNHAISGKKFFCSAAGIVDRALTTVGQPEQRLIDIDLRIESCRLLLQTEGYQVLTVTEISTMRNICGPVGLLVLCHSLTEEDCERGSIDCFVPLAEY